MKKCLLIDTSTIIYRFFYKLMNMKNLEGRPTGATFGVISTLIKLIEKFNPDYIAACFDVKRESLKRREMFTSYKAARPKTPEDLLVQMNDVKKVLKLFGVESLSIPSYEADDVIGTLSKKFVENDIEVYIFTGDKDLLQLLDKNIKIILFGKVEDFKIISNEEEVEEVLGVVPNKIPDLFGLQGDMTDGIPGVKGIGPKNAQKLIKKFGSLDEIYENLEVINPKIRELLEDNREIAFLSKELAKIHIADLEIDINKFYRKDFDEKELLEFLRELGFRSIIKKLDLKVEYSQDSLEYKKVDSIQELKDIIGNEKKELAIFKEGENIAISTYDLNILIKKEIEELDIKNPIIFYNAKSIIKEKTFNINFDVMIGAHLLNPEENISLERIANEYLNINLENSSESLENLLIKKSYSIFKLKEILVEKLNEENLLNIFTEEELPLIPVLANMEKNGIKVDTKYLKEYEKELVEKIGELENKIFELVGSKFNIASPQQLSEVLFVKMGLKPIKKNKNSYSTDNEVLEFLNENGIEIAKYLLEYRKLLKLYNTYVKALPDLCDKNDRIHTNFNQEGTSTGRLSSSKPNLQNIPSKTLEGRKIRKAFIAEENFSLIVADYSQIELRILASISEDEELINAYKNNLDLHMQTATYLFLKEPDQITKIERDKAKSINFSIIYGKSSFGLSKELNIPIQDSNKYIKKYFEKYKGINNFINSTILEAQQNGYVKTLFGRKRFISGINSKNIILKKAAERMAVNAVIQGTQAEIIKRGMVEIHKKFKDKDDIKMLLQVHDELIFEVRDDMKDFYKNEILKIMESCVVLPNVNLEVNVSVSKNWEEAK